MVSYDQPEAAHDMILRFMDVDFSLLVDGTPGYESRLGDQERVTATTSENAVGAGKGDASGGSSTGTVEKLSSWEGMSASTSLKQAFSTGG